jgi:hypothetical protein
MKKIVLLAALVSTFAFGNNVPVPENITSAFVEKFPKAEVVNWVKEFDKYQVEFTQKNIPMTALFNKEGECVETATYIKKNELPEKTLEEIDWYYDNALIVSSKKAKDHKSTNFYRVTVETGEAFFFLKVDEEGDIIDTSVRYFSQNTEKK